MKKIREYNQSSFLCYLYICICILSYFIKKETKIIYDLLTLTGTLSSICILQDFKRLLNKKLNCKNFNIYIYFFIFIKSLFLIGDLFFYKEFIFFINENHIYIYIVLGVIQSIYSIQLIRKDFVKIRLIRTYGVINLLSGTFIIIQGITMYQILLSIISTYIMADIFFQSEDIRERKN
ncbi:hypothetical protein [Cetobacterium sp. SF1]|uniref:hypothetical protein n=1 Tax=unclassified Cetobacterium TaxID=2630983 RepID=UPI003CEA5178